MVCAVPLKGSYLSGGRRGHQEEDDETRQNRSEKGETGSTGQSRKESGKTCAREKSNVSRQIRGSVEVCPEVRGEDSRQDPGK